jgi:hypothetical protein
MNTPLAIHVILQYAASVMLVLVMLPVGNNWFKALADVLELQKYNTHSYWQYKYASDRERFKVECKYAAQDLILSTIVLAGLFAVALIIWPTAPVGA